MPIRILNAVQRSVFALFATLLLALVVLAIPVSTTMAAVFSGSSEVTEGFLSSEEPASSASALEDPEVRADESPSQAENNTSNTEVSSNKVPVANKSTQENLPAAVVWYLEMAKSGDAEAQYNLGTVYETGFGVKVDKEEAARWYEKAAEQDHNLAQLKLGIMYVLGDGTRQSMIKGSRWIRDSADNGNEFSKSLYDKVLSPDAVLEIPATEIIKKIRPTIDQGAKKSNEQLVALLRKQEKKNDEPELKERFTGPSKNTLGKEVDVANDVPQFLEKKAGNSNDLESDNLALLHREANAGNAEAQFQLGAMYETGDKVERDPGKAITWFTSAASRGHADSQYRLAVAYIFGKGVKRNYALGEDWLKKAAQQNQPVANKMLPLYLANKAASGAVSIALQWYLEEAVSGNSEGEFGLGYMYENGWGVTSNFGEARKWYAAARTDGSGGAAKRLRQIKATGAANDPDPTPDKAPQLSEETKTQFASTLTVAGSNSNARTGSNSSSSGKSVVSGRLPVGSNAKSQSTSFSSRQKAGESAPAPTFTTATVTKRSPLTPIILIVFGLIMGITVFKWMRRGSYKKARFPQSQMGGYPNNRNQYNKMYR